MGNPKLFYRIMLFVAYFLALIIITLFYWSRAPVLMITDPSFTLLYGASRAQYKQKEISMKLFRRFIPVLVAENAGPEIVVEAVKATHKAPKAVIFPFHFTEAARRFQEELPKIPVLVLKGRQELNLEDDLISVATDRVADLYKAGVCAGILAQESGNIIIFHEELPDSHKAAFENGLENGGFSGTTIYIDSGSDYYSSWQDISCVVIAGPAVRFFERGLNVPVVLFSWVDPELTPWNLKVLLDDSPWALAVEALEMVKQG